MRKRPGPEPDAFPDGPSKTQLKRVMDELQKLGEALLDLPPNVFDDVEMDEGLRDALTMLRTVKTHEGRRRQLQLVGKIMRDVDDLPLRAAIDAHRAGSSRAAQAMHEIERWRDRLVADDAALTEWIAEHPASNSQPFRTLIRNARRESIAAAEAAKNEGGKPQPKGRAYRELFSHLRDAVVLADAAKAKATREAPIDPPRNART